MVCREISFKKVLNIDSSNPQSTDYSDCNSSYLNLKNASNCTRLKVVFQELFNMNIQTVVYFLISAHRPNVLERFWVRAAG